MKERNLNYLLIEGGFSPSTENPKVPRLTRHMKARLEEFFAVKTEGFYEDLGEIHISVEGMEILSLHLALLQQNVFTQIKEGKLCFQLQACHSFEDIDFLWSILLGILC